MRSPFWVFVTAAYVGVYRFLYSGAGEQQRVFICLSFANDPESIIGVLWFDFGITTTASFAAFSIDHVNLLTLEPLV